MPSTTVFFRGSGWTQVDRAGRIVVPSAFRKRLVEHYGTRVFITEGWTAVHPHVVIYPIAVWENIEKEIHFQADLSWLEKMALMHRLNLHGVETELDDKGRLLIPQTLRQNAELTGKVILVGFFNAIQVWNPVQLERFHREVQWDPSIVQKLPIG